MDSDIVSAVVYAAGSDSHTVLAKGFVGDIRVYVLALANRIITEYDCVTASEKSTVQLAARAMANVMVLSEKLESTSSVMVSQFMAISKEAERANR